MTEKVISIVGWEILEKAKGSSQPTAQRVSPMVACSMPEMTTMSPTVALSQGVRFRPVISFKETTLPL